MQPVFLTAEWRNLILANYIVEPSTLEKYLPAGTEPDFWNGRCYISLVGFLFMNTKVLGISIPLHRNFEEVNLRFYVRRKDGSEWKRGVVFIKEIVPKPVVTFAANTLYNEHYMTLPMRHKWGEGENKSVEYEWKVAGNWNKLSVSALPSPNEILLGSEEEFITQHFWGYTKLPNGKTSEYQVEHTAWRVYPVVKHEIRCDGRRLYGKPFGEILNGKPDSVFLAEGSKVLVRKGRKI